jgi:3-oxoacyl-[acyl-carrier protein] reductase
LTSDLPEEIKNNILSLIPLQRFGTAEEIAEVVAFIASERASYITGQTIPIDGGITY